MTPTNWFGIWFVCIQNLNISFDIWFIFKICLWTGGGIQFTFFYLLYKWISRICIWIMVPGSTKNLKIINLSSVFSHCVNIWPNNQTRKLFCTLFNSNFDWVQIWAMTFDLNFDLVQILTKIIDWTLVLVQKLTFEQA